MQKNCPKKKKQQFMIPMASHLENEDYSYIEFIFELEDNPSSDSIIVIAYSDDDGTSSESSKSSIDREDILKEK